MQLTVNIRITLTLLFCLSSLNVVVAQQYGYKYNGTFIPLYPSHRHERLIQIEERDRIVIDKKDLANEVSKNYYIVQKNNIVKYKYNYISCYFKDKFGNDFFIMPTISVCLKNDSTINIILSTHKRTLSLSNNYQNVYYLSCHVRNAEQVLEIVSDIDKMPEVEWCEPDFLGGCESTNTFWEQQWYLNDSNSYGINVASAWPYTPTSQNVTVAVIDMGVDQGHEDLYNNILNGYTVGDSNGNGSPKNDSIIEKKYHGMACAGIIAANDNYIGIKGVAPGVKILPVNIFPNTPHLNSDGTVYKGGASTREIAAAIRWAYERSDILSCSWITNYSNDINKAIRDAISYGRNGKGCVVVCSSGNNYQDNPNVNFPANIDGVIAVGAINRNGGICDYTQRGSRLDVVAPGEGIYTTDRMGSLGKNNTNYMSNFSGTSAACPQVAGIAALMLSYNPNSTFSDVRKIIQETARDLGSPGKDNTFGFGLVDAAAAICASNLSIVGSNVLCNNNLFYINNLPSCAYVTWTLAGANTSYFNSLPNIPEDNQLTLNKTNSTVAFDGELTAIINIRNHTDTITKHLFSHASVFSGTWSQIGVANNQSFTPGGPPLFIRNDKEVVISSPNFKGMNVVHSGATPSYFYFDNNQTIRAVMMNSSNGDRLNINISGGCESYNITLRVTSGYNSCINPGLEVNLLNGVLHTSLIRNKEDATSHTSKEKAYSGYWSLCIYNSQHTQNVFYKRLSEKECSINISDWPSGIYVIQAIMSDGSVISKKISIYN